MANPCGPGFKPTIVAVALAGSLSVVMAQAPATPRVAAEPEAQRTDEQNALSYWGLPCRGQPVNLQLTGKAWDDPKLVGFGYTLEYCASLARRGHQVQPTAPALPHDNGTDGKE
jgi:amidase